MIIGTIRLKCKASDGIVKPDIRGNILGISIYGNAQIDKGELYVSSWTPVWGPREPEMYTLGFNKGRSQDIVLDFGPPPRARLELAAIRVRQGVRSETEGAGHIVVNPAQEGGINLSFGGGSGTSADYDVEVRWTALL